MGPLCQGPPGARSNLCEIGATLFSTPHYAREETPSRDFRSLRAAHAAGPALASQVFGGTLWLLLAGAAAASTELLRRLEAWLRAERPRYRAWIRDACRHTGHGCHGEPLRDLAREWEGGCPLPCSGPHGSAGGKRVGGAGVAWLGPPGADAGAHAWLCRGTGLSKACDNARPTLNPIRSISLQAGLASVRDGRQRATSGRATATEGVLTSLSAASPSVLGLC